jgi:hypothetical protein
VSVCMKKNSKSDFVTGFFQIECILWFCYGMMYYEFDSRLKESTSKLFNEKV